MKYVIYVLILALNAEGEINRTEFTVEMSSRSSCIEATELVEKKVIEEYPDANSISVECRPKTPWDDSMSLREFQQDDEFVARQ